MSFISIEFLVFFMAVFALYWGAPAKYRWIILLISNLVFYSFAGIQYFIVLLYVTVISFALPKMVNKDRLRTNNNQVFILGIILLLFPLLLFKYTGFIQNNLNIFLKAFNSAVTLTEMNVVLPLGLSFYTFSALSYAIDAIKEERESEYGFLQYATGLSFFPCIVSGPIERQKRLLPQILSEENKFNYENATYGLKLVALGLYKKTVIADNLAVYVDVVWNDLYSYDGIVLLIAVFFYSLQIYCDFSGYSDMARGIAKLLGIEISVNFDSPYLSASFHEFWRRWHISLSTWLRDYVYIPLGGNRHGKVRKAVNIIITMLISGLWHGAAWKFLLWGGIHGLLQVIEPSSTKKHYNKGVKGLYILLVFVSCSFLWVFFRAGNTSDVLYMLTHVFQNTAGFAALANIGLPKKALFVIVIEIALLFTYDILSIHHNVIVELSQKPLLIRWFIYVFIVIMIAQFSYKGSAGMFVYAGF